MKVLFFVLLLLAQTVFAVQKATVDVELADIYLEPDFDSEVVDSVNFGETYTISDKAYGPFYRIKLKNGRIGYIPDHEVAINGKSFTEKPYVEDISSPQPDQKSKGKSKKEKSDDDADIKKPIRFPLQGFAVHLINYHEETMGSIQVDNLLALGYRKMDNTFSWEFFGSFQAPKYYADKTGGSVTGVNLWGLTGFNNLIPLSMDAGFRYGGSLLVHGSRITVQLPSKSYDLQDLSVGALIEGGYFIRFKNLVIDLSMKYFFDRNNYGAFGVSLLF